MGTGYTRQSSAQIAPGSTITALDLENEFDAIQAAMHATTGHTHDGTAGEGPQIALSTSVAGILATANGGISGIHKLNGTLAPTANDDSGDNYAVGSWWIDTTNDIAYVCVDATATAAIWQRVQVYDAELAALAGLTSAADKVPYFTGAGTATTADFTAYGRSLVAVANEAALKTLINLEAGVDFQAWNAKLDDISALAVADGNFMVANGATWTVESGATARASLGLDTGNSPQFTAIELGHASDTTIARTGAGDVTIEGNLVYRAGGTDIPLADGGTGASLADPNADRVLFWDDSAGAMTWLTVGSGLGITDTTLSITASTYTPGGTDVALADGGTGASLADPNADRILFWDDSAGAVTWLVPSTGLSVSATSLTIDTTVMTLTGVQTATNKTFTSPTINGGTIASPTITTPTITTPAITGNVTVTSTDAGAAGAPDITLDRDSASPAASDVLGRVLFVGEDSGGGDETYGLIQGAIIDPTATSEDGEIQIQTALAGTLAARVKVGGGLYTTNATGGDKGADTVNASNFYDDGVKLGITAGTATASTSGTAIDYTSIPAGVKRITVLFDGVSTNGTDSVMIQIGDSGGVEAVSYAGAITEVTDGSASAANFSTGWELDESGAAAASTRDGVVTIYNITGNQWVASGIIGRTDTDTVTTLAGSHTLSATLDRVRITTTGGTNTFDAGTVNIFYE